MQKNHFLLMKKLKNTASAHLCFSDTPSKHRRAQTPLTGLIAKYLLCFLLWASPDDSATFDWTGLSASLTRRIMLWPAVSAGKRYKTFIYLIPDDPKINFAEKKNVPEVHPHLVLGYFY